MIASSCPACTQVIASTTPLSARIRLADVRHRDDLDAAASRGLGEEHREAAAAGDETDALHRPQRQTPRCDAAMKATQPLDLRHRRPARARTCATCSRRLPAAWKSRR